MDWDHEKLKTKAALYGRYAKSSDRNSPLYGLWSSLFIEFLARSALSKIHPVLLADPQDGKNILYTFGVEIGNFVPISVPAKTVFRRCIDLVTDFDEDAFQHCMLMARARNSELHSGEAAFDPMTHNRWQPEHYRVTKILCAFTDENINWFFGEEEVTDIEERIQSQSKELEGRAKFQVKTNKAWFESLPKADQEELTAASIVSAAEIIDSDAPVREHECPACGSPALLVGGRIITRKVQVEHDALSEKVIVVSSRLICGACKLDLSRDELTAIQMPSNFGVDTKIDPVDYFGVDPRDYIDIEDFDIDEFARAAEKHGFFYDEPDYGNE